MELVVPGLWRLPLALSSVNAYILEHDDGLTLVDCGYPGSHEPILRQLAMAGHSPQAVRRIVVTHSDVDHMGSLSALQAATGAVVMAHALEVEYVDGRRPRPWGDGTIGWLVDCGYRALQSTGLLTALPAEVDCALSDGDTLGNGWRVLHTPGHTPGHISLCRSASEVLLTGDALGQRFGRLVGPPPAYAADIVEAAESVAKLAALQPRILCLGHRRPLTNARAEGLAALATRLRTRHKDDHNPQR
jgi:glyoxylase-like metal-dependent hydrolase (beta-lactamase superfamily II)